MLDAKHESSYIRGMNKLPLQKRVQILSMLVEGSSMRSISRITGVSINTVTKLLVDAGQACAAYHDEAVREVPAQRVQCDEIWSFCYRSEEHTSELQSLMRISYAVFCLKKKKQQTEHKHLLTMNTYKR